MQAVYLNPLTDFGFKKLFGEEPHKDLLLAQFNPQERQAYEDSLKHYRDLKNSNDTARLEGLQEGLEEGEKIGIEKGEKIGIEKGKAEGEQIGMTKVVTAMAAKGLDIATIADMTGLPVATVQTLLSQNPN